MVADSEIVSTFDPETVTTDLPKFPANSPVLAKLAATEVAVNPDKSAERTESNEFTTTFPKPLTNFVERTEAGALNVVPLFTIKVAVPISNPSANDNVPELTVTTALAKTPENDRFEPTDRAKLIVSVIPEKSAIGLSSKSGIKTLPPPLTDTLDNFKELPYRVEPVAM